jgi:hypothetical protein
MCLKRITNGPSRMKKEMEGFQVKVRAREERYTGYFFYTIGKLGSTLMPIGNERIKTDLGIRGQKGRQWTYREGFHLFKRKEDAEFYRERLEQQNIPSELVIVKVKAEDPVCIGKQHDKTVYVYRKTTLLEEV